MSAHTLISFAAAALALSTGVVANDSTRTNPSTEQIGLTSGASDWLWAVFAIMLLSDLVFIGWHLTRPRGQRLFHQLPIIILTITSIAYFSMASNLGHTGIRAEFGSNHPTRAIWYVRYINWVIVTPLILLELVLVTGLPLSDIVTLIFMDIAMFVTLLVGALVTSAYKWGYYAFALFAMFFVWWILLGPGRATSGLLGTQHRSAYTRNAAYLCLVWLLYPICWGLAEGGNRFGTSGEMIFYGIIDILAIPVFLFMHVMSLRNIPFESYGFNNFHTGVSGTSNAALAGHNGLGEKRGLTSPMANQNTAGTGATTTTTGNAAHAHV